MKPANKFKSPKILSGVLGFIFSQFSLTIIPIGRNWSIFLYENWYQEDLCPWLEFLVESKFMLQTQTA